MFEEELVTGRAPRPRPFLRWAGGKTAMLPTLIPLLPNFTGTYHEPCLGGGALFFTLKSADRLDAVTLGDINEPLVNAYLAVRDSVAKVVDLLTLHAAKHREAEDARRAGKPTAEHYYYEVRARPLSASSTSKEERAANLVYLNKVCFNGLWRVNRGGQFNVPLGDVKDPVICDEPNLRACSEALQGADVRCQDFGAVAGQAAPGDLVYFDPPYAPTSATSKFTTYSAGGFGHADHARMAATAQALKARDVHVVISNSGAPIVHQLYASGFQLTNVQAPRSMAARGSSRGKVTELVIR